MTPDPVAALLDQLAAIGEQTARLDAREAGHYQAIAAQLASLTARLTQNQAGADPGGYQPSPAPAWQSLSPSDRQEPVARLRAWVDQVYRPGYGHLAATLAPCWPAHDLCLYALDVLASLWSVLYLQPDRTPGLISAQAEFQARLLPALAGQLQAETHRCGHARNPAPPAGHPRSTP
jgi:hypothetical protein